jgi:hypothetical protein
MQTRDHHSPAHSAWPSACAAMATRVTHMASHGLSHCSDSRIVANNPLLTLRSPSPPPPLQHTRTTRTPPPPTTTTALLHHLGGQVEPISSEKLKLLAAAGQNLTSGAGYSPACGDSEPCYNDTVLKMWAEKSAAPYAAAGVAPGVLRLY